MNCDVGQATEGLENELWRRWSDGKVGEWPSLSSILIHYGRQWPEMLTRPKTSNIHIHIDYPTDQLFKEFKVFNIRQNYLNVLLKSMHKNLNSFKQYSHIYSTKGLDTFRLFESKRITTTAFNHSCIFGPRLYNKYITKYPDTINVRNAHFKQFVSNMSFNIKLDFVSKLYTNFILLNIESSPEHEISHSGEC